MEEAKPVVLVVEDERPLLEVIKAKLEKSGMSVVAARTSEQALAYLKDLKKVDGIWLDHYLLGRESGIDFVTKLKAEDSKWRSIPVFVVSNTASSEKISMYLKFGVTKYYTKADYRLDEIIADIRSFLGQEK